MALGAYNNCSKKVQHYRDMQFLEEGKTKELPKDEEAVTLPSCRISTLRDCILSGTTFVAVHFDNNIPVFFIIYYYYYCIMIILFRFHFQFL